MGKDKAFLNYQGKPFLAKIIEGNNSSQLVTRNFVFTTSEQLSDIQLENTEIIPLQKTSSPFETLKKGLQLLNQHSVLFDYVLLCHIDQPCVPAALITRLYELARNDRYEVIIPAYNGKGGHPILFSQTFAKKIINTDDDSNLRNLIHRETQVMRTNVPHPEILTNINTPEEYEKFRTSL